MSGVYKNYDYLIGEIKNNVKVKYILRKNKRAYVVGNCIKCNKERKIPVSDFINNKMYNCYCNNRKYKHDEYYERLYRIYWHMKDRCNNPNNDSYKNYGQKGIKLCCEWEQNFQCFRDWALNNGYSNELTIDRIDSNDDYKPENCRWITLSENVSRSNIENPRIKKH